MRTFIVGLAALAFALPLSWGYAQDSESNGGDVAFTSQVALDATKKFNKEYMPVRDKFVQALNTAKDAESKKGNLEEVKKIDAMIEGDLTQEPGNMSVRTARTLYKNSLMSLCKTYVTTMNAAIKKELSGGSKDEAGKIKSVATDMDKLVNSEKTVSASFKVEAKQDWQESTVEITEGSKVSFYCTGRWSPGTKMETVNVGGGKRGGGGGTREVENQINGDADDFNPQYKIGEGEMKSFGKKFEFTASEAGKLSFSMSEISGYNGKPKGDINIKITVTPPDCLPKLHEMVSKLFEANIKPEDGDSSGVGGTPTAPPPEPPAEGAK